MEPTDAAATATATADGGGISSTVESVLAQLPEWGIKIVGVIALFIIGRWLASKLGRGVQRALDKRDFDKTLARFFGTLVRVLVLIVVILACLSIFGIETTSVAAVLGAAALAVGLALQGSLANFAAGVMLIVFRPFKVGDFIRAGGENGTVDTLGLFTTTMDTPDKRRIIVPNSAVFGNNIENFSHHETRRVEVAVGCDYSADLKATRAALEKAITLVPTRLEGGAHAVFLAGLGDSAVDWKVRVWTASADYWTCHEQTVEAVKNALDEVGIGIPFPQMDLHVDGGLAKT